METVDENGALEQFQRRGFRVEVDEEIKSTSKFLSRLPSQSTNWNVNQGETARQFFFRLDGLKWEK